MKHSSFRLRLFAISVCVFSISGVVDAAEPSPPAASATEANKAIARRLFKAFNEGDLATLTEIGDPRRVFHSATGTQTWPA